MKKYLIIIAISVALLIISIRGVFLVNINGNIDLIEDSIVYKLNEFEEVTSIEITVANKSIKNSRNKKLVLRYCTEDGYPEGYSSPILISLQALENKKIEITNFRNTWFYNEEYHIEIDLVESDEVFNSVSIKNTNASYVISYIFTILIPVSLASLMIFGAFAIVENCKSRKSGRYIGEKTRNNE